MNRSKDSNQNIAKTILKIRQDNKLSQEQFAEIVGVTRQAVSRWEMGISAPNINTLILNLILILNKFKKKLSYIKKIIKQRLPLKRIKIIALHFYLLVFWD